MGLFGAKNVGSSPYAMPGPTSGDRQQALYQGLMAMGPMLMAAGAPSLRPSGNPQMLAQAGGALNNAMRGYMNDVRGQNYRKYMMDRQGKADARAEEQFNFRMNQARQAKLDKERAINSILMPNGPRSGAPELSRHEEMLLRLNPAGWGAAKMKSAATMPQSPFGKLQYDLSKGHLPKDIFKSALEKMKSRAQYFDPDQHQKRADYESSAQRYETATNQINEADDVLASVQQMQSLIDGVDTGTFAETKLGLRKIFAATGMNIDPASIATAEAIKSKGMDFILARIQKTKGAISEKEMNAFKAASAGLHNTPEGNRMILELTQKVTERLKFEANAVRDAYRKNRMIGKVALDDIRIKARKQFGSILPKRIMGSGVPPPPLGFRIVQ